MSVFIRQLFDPITIRFFKTDDLQKTLNFLGLVNKKNLDLVDVKLDRYVERTERLIAKELIRRGIKIWEF